MNERETRVTATPQTFVVVGIMTLKEKSWNAVNARSIIGVDRNVGTMNLWN